MLRRAREWRYKTDLIVCVVVGLVIYGILFYGAMLIAMSEFHRSWGDSDAIDFPDWLERLAWLVMAFPIGFLSMAISGPSGPLLPWLNAVIWGLALFVLRAFWRATHNQLPKGPNEHRRYVIAMTAVTAGLIFLAVIGAVFLTQFNADTFW